MGFVAKHPISVTHPHLLEQWDFDRNELSPDDVTYGSGRKVWWRCEKDGCGYCWESTVNNRTSKHINRGCPACGNRVATDTNNLSVCCPEVAEEWDYCRNEPLLPEDVVPGAEKRVWWTCKSCGNGWKSLINSRTSKLARGCPSCAEGNVSNVSQEWLDILGVDVREHTLVDLGFRVDGYDPNTKTVYEFLGDYWHGNLDRFHPEEINERVGKTFGELNEETMNRISMLRSSGYSVVFIWESDYRREIA